MSLKKESIHRPTVKEIQKIFPNATGVGIILPELGKGLHIEFRQCADFFDELKKPADRFVQSNPLFNLVKAFGVVILKNCAVLGVNDNNDYGLLSKGRDVDGRLIQDPFHYDTIPNQPEFVSAIYHPWAEGREEDTYYALESDVRDAIKKLPTDNHYEDVLDGLDCMANPNYRFRLYEPGETEARQVVQRGYPKFVEDVFRLIPESRKIKKSWLKGEWDIALDANIGGGFVHARPQGRYINLGMPAENPLKALYIRRE